MIPAISTGTRSSITSDWGALGANAFGGAAGTSVVAEHDERAISVVAIPDPAVSRAAVATEDGTIVLAVGGPGDAGFATTWNPANFGRLPQAD